MPPPYSLTGIRQGKIFARLNQWAESDGRGIAGEATTAFVPPKWREARTRRRLDPEIRPNREPEILADPESLHGEGPVEVSVLNLGAVRDPLAD